MHADLAPSPTCPSCRLAMTPGFMISRGSPEWFDHRPGNLEALLGGGDVLDNGPGLTAVSRLPGWRCLACRKLLLDLPTGLF